MAIESQGWSVCWDRAIAAGQEFDHHIAAELAVARAGVWECLAESLRMAGLPE